MALGQTVQREGVTALVSILSRTRIVEFVRLRLLRRLIPGWFETFPYGSVPDRRGELSGGAGARWRR